jgi:hypothetical protein
MDIPGVWAWAKTGERSAPGTGVGDASAVDDVERFDETAGGGSGWGRSRRGEVLLHYASMPAAEAL